MKTFVLVATFACLTTAFPLVGADHGCNGEVLDINGAFYVDMRDPGNPTGNWWFYQESNGLAGLQSGGDQIAGQWSDTCAHESPDQLLY
jgi:hypothetical protein